jgi:hypothetical protein
VIGVIDQPCKLNNSFKRKVYLHVYDRADFSYYREQLSQVNFDNLFASDDIDSVTRSIVKILINEVDKAIPNRIITVRKDNPPWLTTEIKQNIRKKNRQHKRAKKSDLADDWAKFRRIRNRCNKLVINSKMIILQNYRQKLLRNHVVVSNIGI